MHFSPSSPSDEEIERQPFLVLLTYFSPLCDPDVPALSRRPRKTRISRLVFSAARRALPPEPTLLTAVRKLLSILPHTFLHTGLQRSFLSPLLNLDLSTVERSQFIIF